MSRRTFQRDDGTAWAGDAQADQDCSLLHAGNVPNDLRTDPQTGLTEIEAARRLAAVGLNELELVLPLPHWRRLVGQFRSPLIYLLLVALAISVVVWVIEGAHGWPVDAVVITVIVVLNGILGYVQETRAQRAADALEHMRVAAARVVRDGVPQRIPAREVVPGDLLLLTGGDTVAADARLVHANALEVTESALTGRSEPVAKSADAPPTRAELDDRPNFVYRGTAIANGTGRAVVTATGMATRLGQITALTHQVNREPTPLQREIVWIARVLGAVVLMITVVVVATIVGVLGVHSLHDVVTVVLFGVSLAVAAVPEGLPALLSVVLALGVRRMADRSAVVKDLSSVETLGAASVVCSGKTGTLTTGELAVARLISPVGDVSMTEAGCQTDGRFESNAAVEDLDLVWGQAAVIVAVGSCASSASTVQRSGAPAPEVDPVGAAFLAAERKLGARSHTSERFRRLDAGRVYDGHVTATLAADNDRSGEAVATLRGDPEVVLGRCTRVLVGNHLEALDDDWRARIRGQLEHLASDGLLAEALAYRPIDATVGLVIDDVACDEGLIYVGLAGLSDPPRAEAAAAIGEAHRAGVRVIMITGDQPKVAARIARDLQISDEDVVVSGTVLDDLDSDQLREAVREHCQFCQLTPEHKIRIIDALHADQDIVAVTGEGINDAPALKAADIGIAMGRTGTDVAREAAHVILADDHFATIIAAIREGRAVFANIKKFLRYLLSSNMGEVLTVFFGVIFAGAIGLSDSAHHLVLPLLPTQILWINLLTDGAPAMALGVDPETDDLMSQPPRLISDRIVDRSMWQGIGVIGAVMAAATLYTMHFFLSESSIVPTPSLDQARTAGFTVLVIAQLFNTLNARSSTRTAFRGLFANRWLWVAITASALLQVSVVQWPVMNAVFATVPLSGYQWLVCVGMASTVLWGSELHKAALRHGSISVPRMAGA